LQFEKTDDTTGILDISDEEASFSTSLTVLAKYRPPLLLIYRTAIALVIYQVAESDRKERERSESAGSEKIAWASPKNCPDNFSPPTPKQLK